MKVKTIEVVNAVSWMNDWINDKIKPGFAMKASRAYQEYVEIAKVFSDKRDEILKFYAEDISPEGSVTFKDGQQEEAIKEIQELSDSEVEINYAFDISELEKFNIPVSISSVLYCGDIIQEKAKK